MAGLLTTVSFLHRQALALCGIASGATKAMAAKRTTRIETALTLNWPPLATSLANELTYNTIYGDFSWRIPSRIIRREVVIVNPSLLSVKRVRISNESPAVA